MTATAVPLKLELVKEEERAIGTANFTTDSSLYDSSGVRRPLRLENLRILWVSTAPAKSTKYVVASLSVGMPNKAGII